VDPEGAQEFKARNRFSEPALLCTFRRAGAGISEARARVSWTRSALEEFPTAPDVGRMNLRRTPYVREQHAAEAVDSPAEDQSMFASRIGLVGSGGPTVVLLLCPGSIVDQFIQRAEFRPGRQRNASNASNMQLQLAFVWLCRG